MTGFFTDDFLKDYQIGLVGSGALARPLLSLLKQKAETNPQGPRVTAWAGGDKEIIQECEELSIKAYPDCASMFQSQPGLDLAADLSDDGSGVRALLDCAQEAQAQVTIVSRKDAERICRLYQQKQPLLNELSSLRLAKELFIATLNQSENDVLIIDHAGAILFANRAILDCEDIAESDCAGRHWSILRNKFYADGPKRFLKMVLETKRPANENYSETDASGRVQYYRINAIPLLDAGHQVRQMVIVRQNTTNEVHREKQLEASKKMALAGELSMEAAHEIRNPVMVIGGFAKQLAGRPELDEKARVKLNIIVKEARRLEDLVKNMAELGKPLENEIDGFWGPGAP